LDPVVGMNLQKNCLVDPDPQENSDPDSAAYKLVLIAKSQGSLLSTRKIVGERRVRQNFLNMWVTDSAWCCPGCLITIVSLKDACHFSMIWIRINIEIFAWIRIRETKTTAQSTNSNFTANAKLLRNA
jgi:hypothetical protein